MKVFLAILSAPNTLPRLSMVKHAAMVPPTTIRTLGISMNMLRSPPNMMAPMTSPKDSTSPRIVETSTE